MITMKIGAGEDPGATYRTEFGQRRFVRFPVAVTVTGKALQFPDHSIRGTVRDIGRGGLMAEFPVTLVPGSLIQFSLNTVSGPIQDTGQVIWASKGKRAVRHGLAFREVKPREFAAAISADEVSRRAAARGDMKRDGESSHARQAVLVIDDDDSLREVAAAMLDVAGYRPLVARNGKEALRLLRWRVTDIVAVLLNLHLPGESAAELYDRARLVHPEVPVFLTSGEPEASALARFGRSGIAGFLYKPAGIPAWVARIDSVLAEEAEQVALVPA